MEAVKIERFLEESNINYIVAENARLHKELQAIKLSNEFYKNEGQLARITTHEYAKCLSDTKVEHQTLKKAMQTILNDNSISMLTKFVKLQALLDNNKSI